MSPEDFLKLLKEKRYSLDGKEKYSLIRLEKVSAISESNDRKILVVKGRMIVKRKKILAIDFNSCIFISQIGLLKDYGFFPEEFECQRKFGFYWWKVMLAMAVFFSIPIFSSTDVAFSKSLLGSFSFPFA